MTWLKEMLAITAILLATCTVAFGGTPYGWYSNQTQSGDATNFYAIDLSAATASHVCTVSGSYADIAFNPVPEPSTVVLLAIGAISLLGYAWRKRRTA